MRRERKSFSNLIFQASMHMLGLLVSTLKADTFGLELYNGTFVPALAGRCSQQTTPRCRGLVPSSGFV